MKRIISAMLAVIMCVLTLSGCEKVQGDGVSGEADDELYRFASSEESMALVQSVAAVLGGYDFDNLDGLQSTWLLEQAIYEDILAVGKKINDYDGCKIGAADLSALLESRFGIKYSGEDKEIYRDLYARQWTAKAVRLDEFFNEVATYSVELESEYFDFSCCCKMAFAVKKHDTKYSLQLLSNCFEPEFTAPSSAQQAEYLTERLVELLSTDAAKNGATPESFSSRALLTRIAVTSFEGRSFDPKTPYHRSFYMSPDGLWHFSAEEARRIVYEVLGAKFSDFDGWGDFVYNADDDEYVSGLEFGSEGTYSCRNISAVPKENGYSVNFVLCSGTAFESGADLGEYTALFTAEKENGHEFLRLVSIMPAGSK